MKMLQARDQCNGLDETRADKACRIGIGVLCLVLTIFCVMSFIGILCAYFSYESKTIVTEERANYVRAPSVTICAESVDLIPADKMPPEVAPKIEELRTKVKGQEQLAYESSQDMSALPIATLDSITPPISELVKNLKIASSSEQGLVVPLDITNASLTYFRGLTKCYRVFGDQRVLDGYFRDKVFNGKFTSGIFLSFEIAAAYATKLRLKLFISENEEKYIYGIDLTNYVTLDLKKTAWVKVTYKKRTTSRLMSPYSENCWSYREYGFDSANQFTDFCFATHMMAQAAKVAHFAVQPVNSNYTVLSQKALDSDDRTMGKLYDGIKSTCTYTQPACYEKEYLVRVFDQEAATDDALDPKVMVMFPLEPDMHVKTVPKQTACEAMREMMAVFAFYMTFALLIKILICSCRCSRSS